MLFLFGSRKVMVLTLKFVHTEKTFTLSPIEELPGVLS